MQFLGVGLSRTGTTSLHIAMKLLGYRSLHYVPYYLHKVVEDGSTNFRVFDDVDVVTDVPAAFYYRQLAKAYPDLRFILTLRDVESWYTSMVKHHQTFDAKVMAGRDTPTEKAWLKCFGRLLHAVIYGSPYPVEDLYKRRYQEHNVDVLRYIPAERLLIMNIIQGDGWEKLCPFVGKPIPPVRFPHIL